MRVDPIYIRVYILWMNLFVQIIIPFLILIILNTFIYKKIKGFEKRCRKSREGNISISELKVSLGPQSSKSFLNGGLSTTTVTPIMTKANIRRCSSCTSFPNLRKDIANRTKNKNTSPLQLMDNREQNNENNARNEEEFELKGFNPDRKDSNLYKSELNLSSVYHCEEIKQQQSVEKCQIISANEERNVESDEFVETKWTHNSIKIDSRETSDEFDKSKILRNIKSKFMSFDYEIRSSDSNGKKKKANKFSSAGTSLRRREVALAKISLYIVFVMLICHGVRLIPNMYEMIETYTEVKYNVDN